jgi:hypothetical protein
MNGQIVDWMAQTLAADAPLLPEPWVMRLWLGLGWAVVIAWLGVALLARRTHRVALLRAAAGALVLWAALPGPYSYAHWLGLAFQLPSITLVVWCAMQLVRQCGSSGVLAVQRRKIAGAAAGWVVAGVLLGWALLLDTFAVLPVQLYAWGFSPLAVALAMLAAGCAWAIAPRRPGPFAGPWLVAAAVLVFLIFRLPSGNVWDALLDPWLWLGLQVYGLRKFSIRPDGPA